MQTFECQCGHLLFFRNTRCLRCGRRVGFSPEAGAMTALEPGTDGIWYVPDAGRVRGRGFRRCRNDVAHDICNWLLPADSDSDLCRSCRLNRTIPDLTEPRHITLWYRLETAKRHLLYTLYRLHLPVIGRDRDPEAGLAFDFLADSDAATEFTRPLDGGNRVSTGHLNGVITINIAEADDVARTRIREQLGESYRTLIGHFRHEIGHYYWGLLVAGSEWLESFRDLFGDERADYAAALRTHYERGPGRGWEDRYISAYAACHPWEDWAECWAHYLHIVDTLDTAREFGFTRPVPWHRDPDGFDRMMREWSTLTIGINAINRSMGLSDAYPFAINRPTWDKLAFIHHLVRRRTGQADAPLRTTA